MAKGKKARPQTEVEEPGSGDKNYLEDSENEEKMAVPSVKAPKSKKDRKKKKEEELEEAQRELERINQGELSDEVDTANKLNADILKTNKTSDSLSKMDVDEPHTEKIKSKSKKKDKKKKKQVSSDEDASEDESVNAQKSAFSLLMENEDQSDVSDNEVKEEILEVKEKKIENSNTTKDKKDKRKKKKEKKATDDNDLDELDQALAELGLDTGDKDSAAQKKKEKKERQKQRQAELDQMKKDGIEVPSTDNKTTDEPTGDDSGKSKKGKKKKTEEEDQEDKDDKGKKGKKGPGSKMKLAMQEALKAVQEEEERARREEEERIQREEEAERERLEKKRLEEEKKAAKKERERLKKEQLRKEGKLLTKNQKEAQARAQAMLEAMRAQGMDVPQAGVKKAPRPGTRVRNKAKSATPETDSVKEVTPPIVQEEIKPETVPGEKTEEKTEDEAITESWEDEDVAESWDTITEENNTLSNHVAEIKLTPKNIEPAATKDEEEEEESEEDDSEEDEDSSDESDDSEEDVNEAQKRRTRAIARIKQRKEDAEKNRTTDVLRAGVVCVLGHVDTGKTKILDKLRRTNVQDGEAGGITQQIGATNVPQEVIREQCKMVKNLDDIKIPGLLIIDTPGHESFANLRDRGSSLCDIAILVIDIMHGLEPQTIESITLLKKKKTPFVIALNKIDRLYEWKSNRHKDVEDVVKSQSQNTQIEFQKRAQQAIVGMAEQGLNAALYYENPDPKTYISMIPTSAHSGEGMGNLIGMLVKLSQTMLAKRLAFSEELQATVLEVKVIPGLGTTIDICLVNGTLKEGQTMVLAGTDGPIVTPIKALLTPQKMQDLRVKNQYDHHKVLRAAQGVKIEAKELEKVIAGLNLIVANHPDEVDICREEIEERLSSVMNSFKTKDRGVFVQASTLGSLEALLAFLKDSKIPVASVKIGPVVKRDVMKASVMLEHEEKYTIILAFDVKIERDAQEMADNMGVKIFQADIIYHLFDRFTAYQEELKARNRDQFKSVAVFPCKMRMMPNHIFNSRDPIVAGVVVEAGIIRPGTPLCVPSKGFVHLGICAGIQRNNAEVESARKGEEVCIKIDPLPGEAPKMFGRHFDETDLVVSKITRDSIDACKNYFRDDLQKADWQLMVELKKTFEIL